MGRSYRKQNRRRTARKARRGGNVNVKKMRAAIERRELEPAARNDLDRQLWDAAKAGDAVAVEGLAPHDSAFVLVTPT